MLGMNTKRVHDPDYPIFEVNFSDFDHLVGLRSSIVVIDDRLADF